MLNSSQGGGGADICVPKNLMGVADEEIDAAAGAASLSHRPTGLGVAQE